MKSFIMNTILSFLSVDTICKVIALGFSKLITWAAKRDNWSVLKAISAKIRGWVDLIDEVIEDDKITDEEQERIAKAIADCKAVSKIADVLSGETK